MKKLVVVFLFIMIIFSVFACAEEVETIPASVLWLKPALREEPNGTANVIDTLSHGDALEVRIDEIDNPDDDTFGYYYVYTEDGQEGWLPEDSMALWPEVLVIAGDNVQLYESEAMRYKGTDCLAQGSKLTVVGETANGFIVSFRGAFGFISEMEDIYLENTNNYFRSWYNTDTCLVKERVWIYAFPNEDSYRIGVAEAGDTVEVFTDVEGKQWLMIEYADRYGYVESKSVIWEER